MQASWYTVAQTRRFLPNLNRHRRLRKSTHRRGLRYSVIFFARCSPYFFVPYRKLPKLSASLVAPAPIDDPSKHQGRTRSSPHVEGQFAAYVYIPVPLDVSEKLKSLLTSAILRSKGIVPELQCDWINFESTQAEDKQENFELHISLTRPIYLRHYQREDLKRSIKAAAQSHAPLVLAYLSFTS